MTTIGTVMAFSALFVTTLCICYESGKLKAARDRTGKIDERRELIAFGGRLWEQRHSSELKKLISAQEDFDAIKKKWEGEKLLFKGSRAHGLVQGVVPTVRGAAVEAPSGVEASVVAREAGN